MLVLIAGGAGLLGSSLGEALLSEGKDVLLADVFDDSGDGKAMKEERAARLGRHPRARVSRGDLTDARFAAALLSETCPDAVVNAALFPFASGGAAALAAAAREAQISYFVHLSDAALYGPPPEPGRHASEDEAIAPGDDPALEARADEEEAVRRNGLPATVLRVFDVVGPAFPPARFPMPELEAIVAGRKLPPLPEEPRDFLHVRDVVRAVTSTLERRPAGAVLNVGSGIGTTPREVVERLAARAGLEPLFAGETRSARPPRIADVERLFTTLGFGPELGLDRAIEEIVRVRLSRGAPVARRAAAREAAPPLSRRELFGIFRRPIR
jgi:nucleoside-diphosphate-sugar epimerase